MEWFAHHWNGKWDAATVQSLYGTKKKSLIGSDYKNHYAVAICIGLYVPLIIVSHLRSTIKATPERKKTWWFRIWNMLTPLIPFAAIIIGANLAYRIKKNDHFNDPNHDHAIYAKELKIVGLIKPGVDILRTPNFRHPWGQFFADVIPLTLISFMESYSVARRIAAQRNELHILNASQEMWANGAANLLGAVSSAYPVSGSFSRSSLVGNMLISPRFTLFCIFISF
jgi:MFS superfamily sulfate permease-like transporter